jgi:electron transfer flavoprotein alpha subunit
MSVIIFIENTEGNLKKSAFETLTYGFKTAQQLQTKCIAVTIGDCSASEQEISKYGAEKLICIENDLQDCDNQSISEAISQVFNKENGIALVLSNSSYGKPVGPKIAVQCEASFISNVIEIPNSLKVKKKSFSGKAFEFTQSQLDKVVYAISPNSFYSEENQTSISVESYNATDLKESKIKSLNIEKSVGNVSLAEAEVVVSAGRGLKGPENWTMVEELADILNAGTACSKPVSDIGWRPHSEHVGQTGKAIAPNLYIAIGISGAIQHLAGVNSSKVMVAVNTDPEAPFFKAADYGIVGDAFEVVPKIIESLKKFKENN